MKIEKRLLIILLPISTLIVCMIFSRVLSKRAEQGRLPYEIRQTAIQHLHIGMPRDEALSYLAVAQIHYRCNDSIDQISDIYLFSLEEDISYPVIIKYKLVDNTFVLSGIFDLEAHMMEAIVIGCALEKG